MRNLKAYTWEDVLNEDVPRTIIGLELIKQEKEIEKKGYEKMNRKLPRKR